MKNPFSFAAIVALAFSVLGPAYAAQTAEGTWSIISDGAAVQLELSSTDSTGHGSSSHSAPIDPNALGIARALASTGQHVIFHLNHDAGNFVCDGWLANGKGGGTSVFTANVAFFDDLRKHGYDIRSIDQEMAAADTDLTIAYVDAMTAQGLHGDFGQIIALKALNVTPAYVAELRSAGIQNLTPGQIIALRALHVDGAYVNEIASVGFSHLDAGQYISLRALHVDAAYVKYLQAHGLKNLTVGQVIAMKAQHI